MRDNNSNTTETTTLTRAGPSIPTLSRRGPDPENPPRHSLLPSTENFQNPNKSLFSRFKPPLLQPLSQDFERPSFSRIAILAILCLITYPASFFLTSVAKDRSLFIVRVIVSVWCSGVGVALGYLLLRIGAQHLEATSEFTRFGVGAFWDLMFQTAWATVIQMSEGGGLKLHELARGSSSSTSPVPAFHVLRSRFGNRGTARQSRKSYESVPRSFPATSRILTPPQQTTMVPLPRILRRYRHPSSPLTLPTRTHHGDQNLHKCTCHELVSLQLS